MWGGREMVNMYEGALGGKSLWVMIWVQMWVMCSVIVSPCNFI